MSEKKSFNLYLTEETVERAVELDDWQGPSELVETLVSGYLSGDIEVGEHEVRTSAHDSEHSSELDSLKERLSDAEGRLDDFEEDGVSRLNSLRADVEKLDDRVEKLENMAR